MEVVHPASAEEKSGKATARPGDAVPISNIAAQPAKLFLTYIANPLAITLVGAQDNIPAA